MRARKDLDTPYYVIRAKGEKFYRSAYYVNADGEFPPHYVDTETGEITTALPTDVVYIRYTTSSLWDAEDAAIQYTKQGVTI